jgi:two-component system response regulator
VLPAFILLDLKIPKVSGLDVLRQVRANARTKLVPVIVLTLSLHESDLKESYALGGNSYLCKSLDIDRFTFEIGYIARYWLEINKPPPPCFSNSHPTGCDCAATV